MGLIERARQHKGKVGKRITPEMVELALGWANEEVTFSQVAAALKKKSGSAVYSVLALALAKHVKNSNIVNTGE